MARARLNENRRFLSLAGNGIGNGGVIIMVMREGWRIMLLCGIKC